LEVVMLIVTPEKDLLPCHACGDACGFERNTHGSIYELIDVTIDGEIVLIEQDVSPKHWYQCSGCGEELDIDAAKKAYQERK
jgi:hypothetical protein